MPATPFTHDDPAQPGPERHDPEHLHRPLLEEELELERRTRAQFRAAERGGMQWRRRSPNQRFVAHRRGNR
jgi:hypothetical protein